MGLSRSAQISPSARRAVGCTAPGGSFNLTVPLGSLPTPMPLTAPSSHSPLCAPTLRPNNGVARPALPPQTLGPPPHKTPNPPQLSGRVWRGGIAHNRQGKQCRREAGAERVTKRTAPLGTPAQGAMQSLTRSFARQNTVLSPTYMQKYPMHIFGLRLLRTPPPAWINVYLLRRSNPLEAFYSPPV